MPSWKLLSNLLNIMKLNFLLRGFTIFGLDQQPTVVYLIMFSRSFKSLFNRSVQVCEVLGLLVVQ